MRILFILLCIISTPVTADVIYLKNGDRITGEIKLIWDNNVSIKPLYSDEFNINLTNIESIETDFEFDIELYDGRADEFLTVSFSTVSRIIFNSSKVLRSPILN